MNYEIANRIATRHRRVISWLFLFLLAFNSSACRHVDVNYLKENPLEQRVLKPEMIKNRMQNRSQVDENISLHYIITPNQVDDTIIEGVDDKMDCWSNKSGITYQIESSRQFFIDRSKSELPLIGAHIFIDAGIDPTRNNLSLHHGDQVIFEDQLYMEIARMTAYALEAMGANVHIIAEDSIPLQNYARIFSVAEIILHEEKKALESKGKDTSEIQTLIDACRRIVDQNSDEVNPDPKLSPRGIAQGLGISPEARKVLDYMRDLENFIYIDLSVDRDRGPDQLHGYRLTYLPASLAKANDEKILRYYFQRDLNRYLPSQPAYTAYRDQLDLRFARCLESSLYQYLPQMASEAPSYALEAQTRNSKAIQSEDFPAARYLNIPTVRLSMGNLAISEDIKFLLDEEKRYLISKALSTAIYDYFCTQLNA